MILLEVLTNVLDKMQYLLQVPKTTPTDIVEIIIIAFLVYQIMLFIKSTRTWNLFKGIVVILFFTLIAAVLKMNTILWLAEKTLNVGLIALVVVFQPELRNALERLGRKNFLVTVFSFDNQKSAELRFSEKTVNEIVKAVFEMAKVKTGALIVMEKDTKLVEYTRTGIDLDSLISSQLLLNIFEHNTPLHDGAIVTRGDRIVSATCYLPLSDNLELSKALGTRHRAAVGVSECSDSLTIVVSEETGKVSIAENGKLKSGLNTEELKEALKRMQKKGTDEKKLGMFKGRLKNVEKADK